MTHEYKRNETLDLFAAFKIATGELCLGRLGRRVRSHLGPR
jgi:hypothetical protein